MCDKNGQVRAGISIILLPSSCFWPGEDHQVELAVTVVNEIAGVAALVEEGVLLPVLLVGGVVGHQGLDSFDIDTLTGQAAGAQLNVEEADEVVEVLGNRNRIFGSRIRSCLGQERSDRGLWRR